MTPLIDSSSIIILACIGTAFSGRIQMNYLQRAKNFRAKKGLGQNFLVDSAVLNKIIDAAEISPSDTILEIGAGLGFVTEEIAKKAKRVIAVEIDHAAIFELQKLPYDNIEIIKEDILKLDITKLSDKPLKIIANIPYYITSPILFHLLGEIDEGIPNKYISEIILTVQYEVARRITADEKSPSKEYGILSILLNYKAQTAFLSKILAKSFYPSPKVDSAIVKLTLRDKPLVEINNIKLFKRIIKASFASRRKTLKNGLMHAGFNSDIVAVALEKINVSPLIRGETLSIEDFKNLTDEIEKRL